MLEVLDLFSGIGGFSLGLERAGMKTVAFCEIEPYARRVLAKHWPGVPIFEDVRSLTADVLCDAGIGVDLICGGFPCQDISEAGVRGGIDGERSGLWKEFARLIREIRPGWVVVENVRALRTRGLETVLGDLAEIGFDAEWHCLPASFVGSPQLRERMWIVAYPKGRETRQSESRDGASLTSETRENQASQIRRRLGLHGKQDWHSEPAICRVVNGISANVDRISVLGNAVVPQIPELIGRAILASEVANATP